MLLQVHTFYEAVGLMISAESEAGKRDEYLARLMGPPNATWQQILAQARTNPEILKQQVRLGCFELFHCELSSVDCELSWSVAAGTVQCDVRHPCAWQSGVAPP